jgi:hypothetical protein
MWWEEPPGVVEDGILYIDFIVNRKLPFFKRLILIVKYIFNIDDFSISEEILLHDQEAKKLRDILNKIC